MLPHFVAPQGNHDPCLGNFDLFPHKHPKGISQDGKNPRGQKPRRRVSLFIEFPSPFPPHMMLALLIYSYANGLVSSRKIERATHRDVATRYLPAGTHPDHDTICKFRRKNLESFRERFVDVLELAHELKLLKLDKVSLEGTHLKANASIDQNVSYKRAVKIRGQLILEG
ncbi:MAG: transposase [Roseibacillus sp.]|nr:transposase [Roseibacillus sp.]